MFLSWFANYYQLLEELELLEELDSRHVRVKTQPQVPSSTCVRNNLYLPSYGVPAPDISTVSFSIKSEGRTREHVGATISPPQTIPKLTESPLTMSPSNFKGLLKKPDLSALEVNPRILAANNDVWVMGQLKQ